LRWSDVDTPEGDETIAARREMERLPHGAVAMLREGSR
jgi:hypothetical protein